MTSMDTTNTNLKMASVKRNSDWPYKTTPNMEETSTSYMDATTTTSQMATLATTDIPRKLSWSTDIPGQNTLIVLSTPTSKSNVDTTLLSTPTPKSDVDTKQLPTPTSKSDVHTTLVSTPTPKSDVHTTLVATQTSKSDVDTTLVSTPTSKSDVHVHTTLVSTQTSTSDVHTTLVSTQTPTSDVHTPLVSTQTPKSDVHTTLVLTQTPKFDVHTKLLSNPTPKSDVHTTLLLTPMPKSDVKTTLFSTLFSSTDILPSDEISESGRITESKLSTIGQTNVLTATVLYLETSSTPSSVGTAMKMTRSTPAHDALRSVRASTTTSSEMTRSAGRYATDILLPGNYTTKLHARRTLIHSSISTTAKKVTPINMGLKDSLKSMNPPGSEVDIFDKPMVVVGVASAAGLVSLIPLIACIYRAVAKGSKVLPVVDRSPGRQ